MSTSNIDIHEMNIPYKNPTGMGLIDIGNYNIDLKLIQIYKVCVFLVLYIRLIIIKHDYKFIKHHLE